LVVRPGQEGFIFLFHRRFAFLELAASRCFPGSFRILGPTSMKRVLERSPGVGPCIQRRKLQDVSPQAVATVFYRKEDGRLRICNTGFASPLFFLCLSRATTMLSDRPFSKMICSVCRNVLIYIEPFCKRTHPVFFFFLLPLKRGPKMDFFRLACNSIPEPFSPSFLFVTNKEEGFF